MSKKPLYACGTCGLYFSRRYNANRHNRNLHYNKADIRPFQEYMLGRMSGKYMPGNPSSYGIKNRSTSESGVVHQYENNNNNNSHFSQQKMS
ncbi:MAG: hypothetical protein ACJ73C_02205 [Nitrososphaeraceae archaeon]